ncbi:MAG: HAMP domain-containing sensor histidine kinase, partial [Myxococcota bacterium]
MPPELKRSHEWRWWFIPRLPSLRSVVALLPPLLALTLQLTFWSLIQPYVWFLFYPAVFAASWLGGLGAGLRATFISTALVWWFFVPPERAWMKDEPQQFIPAAVFVGMGVLFSIFHGRLRQATQRAAEALATAQSANAELHQANAQITRLYEKTRELDELKTQFFANVSHELRTPLALILGPVERLLATPGLSESQRRDLQMTARNANALLRHVNDLLDISKLEAGRMKLDYSEEDLVTLARFVAGHFEVLARERGIAFRLDVPPALGAQVDQDKLQRVLLNLLANAFKFTPEGGCVRVSIREDASRGWARMEVADSGPGIPQDMREAVFERFRQLDTGVARRFGGTGLGLAIARDFVGLHQGTISVDTAPEGG